MDTSMNFDAFTAAVVNDIQKRKGENCQIFSNTVRKNNGVELTGIIMKREDCNAFPTVYIDDFYEEYRKGADYDSILSRIINILEDARVDNTVDLSDFLCYEKTSSRIVFKLVNYEKNRELLKEIPYKIFYNLAVVFYYTVMEPPFCGRASILIYNSHMEKWGVDAEELFLRAMENTPRLLPAQIENLEELMFGMLEGCKEEEFLAELRQEFTKGSNMMPMYVLTNRQKLLGAACMLYPHVIRDFAKRMEKDVYILPSSVHEVILLPFSEYVSKESLVEMVTEINSTQVEEYEVLADSVYYYKRSKDCIEQIM